VLTQMIKIKIELLTSFVFDSSCGIGVSGRVTAGMLVKFKSIFN
jgi:hypothetical protein